MPVPIRRRRLRGEVPFTVPEVAGLKARWQSDRNTWQDTGLTTPAVADTDPVGGWVDTFAGVAATQAGAGNRPTLKLSVFPTGKPGLLFVAASSQALSGDALAANYTGANLPFTFVTIYQLAATSVTCCHCSMGRGAAANPYSLQQITSTNVAQINRRNDTAGSNLTANATLPAGKITTTPHCLIYWFDGTNGAMYIDGSLIAAPASVAAGTLTLDRFTIGAWRRTEASPPFLSHFGGHMGELAAYNLPLTADSINRWSRYAAKTYGAPYG